MFYSNNSRRAYDNNNAKRASTDITVRVDTVTRHMMTLGSQFERAAMHPNISFQRECVFAKHIINNSDYLTGIALTNPRSFETAFLQLASSGLTLDPSQKLAYMVPRNGRVILDVSYLGLIKMATDEGLCQDIVAELVFEKDAVFKPQGRRNSPIHEFDPFASKGDLILTVTDKGTLGARGNFRGVYVDFLMRDGRNLVYFVTVEDLAAARAVSESWKKVDKRPSSPWTTFPWKMVLKSALKQTVHLIPGNRTRLSAVIDYLNTYGEEGFKSSAHVPVEAAAAEMAQRQAAQAANNEVVSSQAKATDDSVIEGEVVARTDVPEPAQPAQPVQPAQSVVQEPQQAPDDSRAEPVAGGSQPEELQVPMSDIPGVRQSSFKRIAKLVTRAEKTLAYETMIAELKDAFSFNDSELAYAKRQLEQSRRDLLSAKVTESVHMCDFGIVNDFVNRLADSEFKASAIKWVSSVEAETKSMQTLYSQALQSGQFDELESALNSVKHKGLKEMVCNLISTAKAA
ncbi:TPA: recombinase RecT [Providencia rettgeri]|nr:recombinase RecT [Providencia rettgeri]